ncbi:SLC13 family permease [Gracilibacillus halotolerans]
MMEWVVLIAVLVMLALSLLRIHVIFAIIIAAIVAGLMAGMNVQDTVSLLIEGMGGQASTALSYILLGIFAAMISYTGITGILVQSLIRILTGKKTMLVLVIGGIACLSQNIVPVHIAFIPILIPPLLKVFDEMKLDRRAVATALTFGLKTPYVMIPVGYGLIFHETIQKGMENSGVAIEISDSAFSMLIPGAGMILGFLIATFISYRKDRVAIQRLDVNALVETNQEKITFQFKHGLTIVAILVALIIQIITSSLVLGALSGIIIMVLFLAVPFKKGDDFVQKGVAMMGTIAFVMLVASGFAHILKETGAVDALVDHSQAILGDNKVVIAFILLLVGLIVTLGIGSSFGTIPILAALYVPICLAAGFSPMATAALIGTAAALGDAGSPASDSTLGPTSGLNADGKHHHIWDTCVPTFLHFNIPLLIFGWIASIIL